MLTIELSLLTITYIYIYVCVYISFHHKLGSKLRPKVLQHVAVPVIENPVCESWHKTKGIDIRIYDEMMCAGYEIGQRDACQVSSECKYLVHYLTLAGHNKMTCARYFW